ncbi:MAG: arsenite methyltransferase [Elusimicrobia bacterium]|nr:arsenite methyltransferase [Elusimicrobiota bacterium]
MTRTRKHPADVHSMVRKAYGEAAKKQSSCCPGSSCCGSPTRAASEGDIGLSCGDPVAFSRIKPGDIVLDLGSGAGKDVFLAARLTGASGRVIGVDMTGEMLALARRNAEEFKRTTGLANVEFRQGQIEALPLKDASVDIVISNCVINLSPDKPKVFREAFRVLKPGGRLVVSDIVLEKTLPPKLKADKGLYAACISGALPRKDYLKAVRDAGFEKLQLLADRAYKASGVQWDPITRETGSALDGAASSITLLAFKSHG